MCSLLRPSCVFAALATSLALRVVLDSSTAAHTYAGHGGLSAGASSRLLADYDPTIAADILDFLFKPNHGANLHTLKVEIGGDTQRTDLSCNRGYEFWLLSEAKKRNPDIKTYALSWGVPYWVGNGSFFSADNWAYQTAFLTCMRETLQFDVDYIGIWNERSWGSIDYVVGLRNALDAAGFASTRIVIPDGGDPGAIVSAASANASFRAAIDVVGLHYPCSQPYPGVQALGLDYWASEDWWSNPDWPGAGCWGHLMNHNYVAMNMTATIAWSPIWAVYSAQPYQQAGLMLANEPWSGHYNVSPPLWTAAQWLQFTAPGWRFLSVPGGGSGYLPLGGTYVTLIPPDAQVGFTLILETLAGPCNHCGGVQPSSGSQTITFKLQGASMPGPGATLYIWTTNSSAMFVQQPSFPIASDGTFTVTIVPDEMITVTTISTGNHGEPSQPIRPSGLFPLPYSDDFSGYAFDSLARYFSDQYGSFAVRNGKLQQVVTQNPGPNAWVQDSDPFTVIGEAYLDDYGVTVDVGFPVAAPALGDGAPAMLVDCDASSPYQIWRWNVTGSGYLSNAPADKNAPGDTQCLNIYGCESQVVYWSCVTEGGTCCGGDCYENLQWQLVPVGQQPAAPVTVGMLRSVLDQLCVTRESDSSFVMSPCTGSAAQVFAYNASSGSMTLSGTSKCLAQPAPPPVAVYTQLCGRVTNYNGFEHPFPPPGYCAVLYASGNWTVTAGSATLLSGYFPSFNASQTHNLLLNMSGNFVVAAFDHHYMVVPSNNEFTAGQIGLGSGYHFATFDNFATLLV